MYNSFEATILNSVRTIDRLYKAKPLFLGGVTGSGGGVGSPTGGFVGYLPQSRVAFDLSEVASSGIPASGQSLLDNLNRIRYELSTLEEYSKRLLNNTRVTTTYAILVTDDVVFCNTDSAEFTVTLPSGIEGQTFRIINSGASSNSLTLAPSGAEKLLGENSNFTLLDKESLIVTFDTIEEWY